MKKFTSLIVGLGLLALTACGFHLPNETSLSEAVPEINVLGDYHNKFFKMVIQRLQISGVKTYVQDKNYVPKVKGIPTLRIPNPSVSIPLVAVSSTASALEYDIIVKATTSLAIPHHRTIVMRNSITRSTTEKSGRALASSVERNIVIEETLEALADQVIMRLGYMGKMSDPDEKAPRPTDLLRDETDPSANIDIIESDESNLTLLEAIEVQNKKEAGKGKKVTLDEMNNGRKILDHEYELPKIVPEPVNSAPESLSEENL